MDEIVDTFADCDGTRRVLVVRRDGRYMLRQEYYHRNVFEGDLVCEGWVALPGAASFYADRAIAVREARATHPWLA